ncbi:suppressor of fused domain protein [Candidatus Peregrinibacteria bacterium]|nr:MAG: suppressor of fused domain protein [Candidatus Peregrinibacteria bacterium]
MIDHFIEPLAKKLKKVPSETKVISSLRSDLPPIYLFIFRDTPDEGLTTFVTYGLSEAAHPKWHFGRPELILSVESTNEAWGIALASLVNKFRGEKTFANGSTYQLDIPITDQSAMNGFVIFAPSFLTNSESVFELPYKTVYLSQAYPIYPNESLMIEKLGFESFWSHKEFTDPYNPSRKDVSILEG